MKNVKYNYLITVIVKTASRSELLFQHMNTVLSLPVYQAYQDFWSSIIQLDTDNSLPLLDPIR